MTKIIRVQGNKLPLIIPLQTKTITQQGTVTEDYIVPEGATVSVVFTSKYKPFGFPASSVDGNLVTVTDNGTLPVGVYAVEVQVKEADGTRLRSKFCNLIDIRDCNDGVTDEYVDFIEGAVTLDNQVFWFAKGDKGDKGDPFTFEDFTPEQIEILQQPAREAADIVTHPDIVGEDNYVYRWNVSAGEYVRTNIYVKGADGMPGERGPQGEKGEKGDSFQFVDFTPEQLAQLQGIKGDKGDKGDTGEKGDKGDKGDTGEKGDKGDAFTFNDFTPAQILLLKGEKGERGDTGTPGRDGQDGQDGDPGVTPQLVRRADGIYSTTDNGQTYQLAALFSDLSYQNQVNQTATTVSIHPNVLNVWGEVASLVITLSPGPADAVNEYMLQFTVSGTAFTLTLPNGIRWSEEPDWEDGYTYQVSIQNGLAFYAEWGPVN